MIAITSAVAPSGSARFRFAPPSISALPASSAFSRAA
jgi:hypothetical protein